MPHRCRISVLTCPCISMHKLTCTYKFVRGNWSSRIGLTKQTSKDPWSTEYQWMFSSINYITLYTLASSYFLSCLLFSSLLCRWFTWSIQNLHLIIITMRLWTNSVLRWKLFLVTFRVTQPTPSRRSFLSVIHGLEAEDTHIWISGLDNFYIAIHSLSNHAFWS